MPQAVTSFIRKMSGGGSDSRMRSKISRGNSENETECIANTNSGGVSED